MRLSTLLCSHAFLKKLPAHMLQPLMFPDMYRSKIESSKIMWRLARPEDFQQVIKACDAFYATDYVPAYFHKMLKQPNRRTFVLTTEDNHVLSLCSAMVLNGGEKLYFSSGRTNPAFRFQRLLGFLSTRVLLRILDEFPRLDTYLWLTRFDDQIFPQRFWPSRASGMCSNRILSALYILQLGVALRNYDSVLKAYQQSVGSNAYKHVEDGLTEVETVRFDDVYELVSRSGNADQLFANGYVPIDSQVYLFHRDNFTAKNNLLDTQVYVSRNRAVPSRVEAVSFCIVNVCPVGLHLKVYHYSTSQAALQRHVLYALQRSSKRLHALRNDESQLAPFRGLLSTHNFEPDRVFVTLVFSTRGHEPRELRNCLFDAGMAVGASGSSDVEIQYVCGDEPLTHAIRSREPYLLAAIEDERRCAAKFERS